MSGTLFIRNRQRTLPVNTRYWRRLLLWLLQDRLPGTNYDLGIYLVRGPEMTRLNEAFLGHRGPTDVITFDYSADKSPVLKVTLPDPPPRRLSGSPVVRVESRMHGEIFVCLDEAVAQARRYHTSWQSELVRYSVHGILHLSGYGDTGSSDRREMKREEDRLLRQLGRAFALAKVAGRRNAPRGSAGGRTGGARLSLERARSAG